MGRQSDIVLPKFDTVILVHGCFWHGHEHCEFFRMPKSRAEWWTAKIEGNRARDVRNESALRELGWHVVTIWECAVNTIAAREWLWRRLPQLIDPAKNSSEPFLKVAEDQTPYRIRKR